MFLKKKEVGDEDLKESEKKELVNESSISLKVEGYNDIFSSFDPRHYLEKALSADFLDEAKRATRDTPSGKLTLQIMVSKEKRSLTDENFIKKRMREHFKRHYIMLLQEVQRTKDKGIFMTVLGIIFITIGAYISSLNLEQFFSHFAIIVLEPAGWFTAWTGLDQLYYTTKEMKPDMDFYEKMSNAEIRFIGY